MPGCSRQDRMHTYAALAWQRPGFAVSSIVDHLFGDGDVLLGQRRLRPAVAVAAMVLLEDVCDGLPHLEVLVASRCTGSMVEVRASCKTQLCKELRQVIVLPEGVNQQCLFPVGQELQIDVQAFF